MITKGEYLSKENTNCLKAIFALGVIFCHLIAPVGYGLNEIIGAGIASVGYLSVSGFIFCTGYGLASQYINKGNDYFKGFLTSKILPLYIINSLLIVIYTAYYFYIGEDIGIRVILTSFFFGATVVKYGWYIQMIMLFYFLFFVVVKKFSLHKGLYILTILTVLYSLLCFAGRLETTWYEGSLCFLLGILWAMKKDRIDIFLKSRYIAAVLVVALLFGASYIFGNVKILPYYFKIPLKMVSAAVFIILVLLLLMKLKINFKPFVFLGDYYFEIYVFQGWFILFFKNILVIENILLYCICCFGCTLVFSIAIHPVIQKLYKKCRLISDNKLEV